MKNRPVPTPVPKFLRKKDGISKRVFRFTRALWDRGDMVICDWAGNEPKLVMEAPSIHPVPLPPPPVEQPVIANVAESSEEEIETFIPGLEEPAAQILDSKENADAKDKAEALSPNAKRRFRKAGESSV